MKPFSKTTWSTLALSAFLVVSATAIGFNSGKTLDATQTKAAVTALTAEVLENSQFAHQRFDDELAGKFLDRYLDALDGSHLFFLQSDVADFARFRPDLAQQIRLSGDTQPAQVIFKRYLERLDQRAAYVAQLLKAGPFAFTADEHFQYDRKDAPRPADLDAAKELWRQNLRFEYLQEKLAGKKDADIAQTLSHRSARLAQTMHKFNDQAVLDLYLNALAHVYDPHSDYMDREELQSFNVAMNHSLVGIGATLQTDDGYCKVGTLVPGGPAARNGQIKPGDRIVGVAQGTGKNFTDLVDMPLPQAVDLIRGAKGTTVRLEIIPAGAADNASRKTVAIMRDEIKLEDQQAKARIVDLPVAGSKTLRIGIIDLPGFYAGKDDNGVRTSATADVARLVRKLKEEGIKGLILDLRRNGGGALDEAINLTGLFIPAGPVVQTRTPDGRVDIDAAHDRAALYDGPLVVLTSRMSASASEIVAGALQDYGRAVIVGDSSTFGKGTVQTMLPLADVMQQQGLTPSEDPGLLKVTISKFYRPSGQSTQLAGVKSDIVLPSVTDTPEISEGSLDNPLPWDTIPAAHFTSENRVQPYLPLLRDRSAKRVAKSPDFTLLRENCEQFRKNRATKSVSLNEAARRAENAAIKSRTEAAEKASQARKVAQPQTYEITLKNVDQPGPGKLVKDSTTSSKATLATPTDSPEEDRVDTQPSNDILLQETEHILSDYQEILTRENATVAAKG